MRIKSQEFIEKLKDTLETDMNVTIDTQLNSIEGFDSIGTLGIIVLIDESFGIQISGIQFKTITTVRSLQELIGLEKFED